MSSNRVAVVTHQLSFGGVNTVRLCKIFDPSPLLCTFEDIRDHLGKDTDGLMVIVAASRADREPITRLIQEIRLRKLPPVLILLLADKRLESDLAFLDPYIDKRLRWPEEAAVLSQLRESYRHASAFTGTRQETLEEILSRRLLAQTPSLLSLVKHIALTAAHDITVLLSGETGTGKSYLARLIHECSPRKEQRFLTVPCGALAANLVESEFFGHVQGAFTGADRPKVGKFAAVGGGTLFLDEVDTLAVEQQVALLRVIETGEFEPVGSNETQHSAARLVVASNLNLEEEVQHGRFRHDLYYRLNIMAFHLPPLRERPEDIAPLVRSMAARFSRKFRKELFEVRPEALAVLESFSWPGNIRQLENMVQHAVLVSAGQELLLQHLPPMITQELDAQGKDLGRGVVQSLRHNRELLEQDLIQRALLSSGYNLVRTANALGISRVTLYKKLKKYGLSARRCAHDTCQGSKS